MLKNYIKAFIKSNRPAYLIYYYLGSAFIRFICLFLKTNNNQILFVSYGGKKYDDSPRYLYEYIKDNEYFSDYKLIWAFVDPSKYKFLQNKIKIDTLKYYIQASKSRFWITNSSVSRGLNFQKKSNINLIFSHGITAIKKCGADIQQKEQTYRLNFIENFNNIFIEGKNEAELVAKSWLQNKSKIVNLGLPRNDDLVNTAKEEIETIKNKLSLSKNKKIILYAPTFRELQRDKDNQNYLNFPITLEKWEKEFSNKYQMIITSHYEVARFKKNINNNNFVKDFCEFPSINDLLKVSDVLITDYSNILFDYSIFERPIFCYGYDYDEFSKTRGFYTDLDKLFLDGIIKNEDELIYTIKNMDLNKHKIHTKSNIKSKYLSYFDGQSTRRIINYMTQEYIN